MTTKQMVYTCDNNLRNITKDDNIFIPTTEWLLFLNQAQEYVFRQVIPLDADTYSQFDLNQTARSNLASLIKDKQYIASDSRDYTTSKFSGVNFIFDYPSDLKYVDVAEVNIISTKNSTSYLCRCKDIEPRFYHMNRKNPFQKPFTDICWRMDYGGSGRRYNEIVIPSNFTLQNFTLRYISNLTCLDYETDSLLSSNLHVDIVNKAVELCIKAHQGSLLLERMAAQDDNKDDSK